MDLTQVGNVFINTPTVNKVKPVSGVIPLNVQIPKQVEGSLTVLHTINQGSEIRIVFDVVPSYRIEQLRSTFTEGSLHQYDNNQYIVTNYSETTDNQPLKQFGIITTHTVEVVLIVYSYLKAQVAVKLNFPSTGSPFISAQSIAQKTGLSFSGFDFQIPVTKDNADNSFNFTLKDEIEKRAYEFMHFIFYGSQCVFTQPLQTTRPVVGEISPFQVSGSPPVQYTNARIEWANNSLSPFRNDPVYLQPTPQVVYLVEGDLDVTQPPDNITAFRDQKGVFISNVGLDNPNNPKDTPLDQQSGNWYQATRALYLVFDNGGQTKEVRITKKVDGVTEYVENWRYGFMFTAYGFAAAGGSPTQYWRAIEYKKTVYQYTKANRNFDTIKYRDRAGVWRTAIVSDSLKLLLKSSRVGYLTSTTTTGWRYMRFQTEQQGGWDIAKDTSIAGTIFWGKRLSGGIDGGTGGNNTAQRNYCEDMLQLYIFRKIPINGKTQYHLVESESIYNDTFINTNKEVQANIEKIAWNDLPDNLKNSTTPDSEGFVGIARPDPDSYKEYVVLSERTEEIALAWRTNPLAKLYDSANQKVGDKTPTISADSLPKTYLPSLEPYVIGENTISTIERKIIPNRNTSTNYVNALQNNDRYKIPDLSTFNISRTNNSVINSSDRIDKYVEYTTSNTSRGISFEEQATITTFAEFEGRPPLATVQRTAALQSDIQKDPFFKTDREYYYTSVLDSDFPVDDSTTSFSIVEIKSTDIESTRRALDFKLRLENANSTKELTVDLGYYRPEYRVGSLTSLQEYTGQWLIRRVEHSFAFSGEFIVNKLTRLTLGYWYDVQSQITTNNPTIQPPNTLPYNSAKYNILGGKYPLEFNKPQDTPSISGNRGTEEPSLSFISF